jgi:hypothetical protein
MTAAAPLIEEVLEIAGGLRCQPLVDRADVLTTSVEPAIS